MVVNLKVLRRGSFVFTEIISETGEKVMSAKKISSHKPIQGFIDELNEYDDPIQ